MRKKQKWVEEQHYLPDGSRMWSKSEAWWTVAGALFFGVSCMFAASQSNADFGATIGVAACFTVIGQALARLFPRTFLTWPKGFNDPAAKHSQQPPRQPEP